MLAAVMVDPLGNEITVPEPPELKGGGGPYSSPELAAGYQVILGGAVQQASETLRRAIPIQQRVEQWISENRMAVYAVAGAVLFLSAFRPRRR